MTDQQINQAIAEACGIVGKDNYGPLYHTPDGWVVDCPQFCTDLNAMYEAEEQMDEIDWIFFMTELSNLVRLPKQAEVQIKQLVHSTARHRAQALLRVLGKWEEGK
jgi:cell division ATPase FtsA